MNWKNQREIAKFQAWQRREHEWLERCYRQGYRPRKLETHMSEAGLNIVAMIGGLALFWGIVLYLSL